MRKEGCSEERGVVVRGERGWGRRENKNKMREKCNEGNWDGKRKR